jgi:hypothetical protein
MRPGIYTAKTEPGDNRVQIAFGLVELSLANEGQSPGLIAGIIAFLKIQAILSQVAKLPI